MTCATRTVSGEELCAPACVAMQGTQMTAHTRYVILIRTTPPQELELPRAYLFMNPPGALDSSALYLSPTLFPIDLFGSFFRSSGLVESCGL